MWKFSLLLSIFHVLSASVLAGRHHQSAHRDFRDRYGPIVTAAASQHVSQVSAYRLYNFKGFVCLDSELVKL